MGMPRRGVLYERGAAHLEEVRVIVSINQPAYLPWLGYFDRIRQSDLHIVLDHVQFEKGSFTNRTRIRGKDGRVFWLTIPVEKDKPINETRVLRDGWDDRH